MQLICFEWEGIGWEISQISSSYSNDQLLRFYLLWIKAQFGWVYERGRQFWGDWYLKVGIFNNFIFSNLIAIVEFII